MILTGITIVLSLFLIYVVSVIVYCIWFSKPDDVWDKIQTEYKHNLVNDIKENEGTEFGDRLKRLLDLETPVESEHTKLAKEYQDYRDKIDKI